MDQHLETIPTQHSDDQAAKHSPSGRPVDLVHLSRYTLGNRALEREVLELFRTQSCLYLQRLKDAMDNGAWRDAAHTIKGSARGIGAWQVATAAAAVESLEDCTAADAKGALIDDLALQIDEANGFIATVLADV